jgi:osmotically-inducible protein OsmY
MTHEVSRTAAAVVISVAAMTSACSRSPPERVGHTEITSVRTSVPGPATAEDQERLRRAEEAATQDLQITVDLQRRLDVDDALSVKGKSVTIITVEGKVTLRGSVANAEEAAAIVDKTRSVPGVIAVENLLEYPPSEL